MNALLKASCLAIYFLAALATVTPLAWATPLQYAAALLLGGHMLEGLLFFRHVKRYPGPLAKSLWLTLLYGLLHWLPLRQLESDKFKGKVVVITGAGSGIGRALAQQFAGQGARLALSDINAAGLAETIKGLPAGSEARGYKLDASSWEGFQAHAEEVKRDFGTAHMIVNNAGATIFGTVDHTSIEEFRWQLDLNMYGVLYGTKAFLPMLLAQREGWIVNISSVFGLLSFPTQSAYNMSKFAVRGLTECLWQELDGTGVEAVCVHPGGIKTNVEKAGRRVKLAGPEDQRFTDNAEKILVTLPEHCATEILLGLHQGDKRILTGHMSSTIHWLSRLLPNRYPAVMRALT